MSCSDLYVFTYHIVYPRGDKSRLTVIDMQNSVSYELSDYSLAYKDEFLTSKEAISVARKLAEKYNLKYDLFISRYGNESEIEYLTLD